MPFSYTHFDAEIRDLVERLSPSKTATILDVGAGAGKFARLLFDYPERDALEVHEPYVSRFGLRGLYRRVFVQDVRSFTDYSAYDLVLFGDVLEHMDPDAARTVLERAARCGCHVVVAVPFLYEQGEVDGNPHEEHVQDDLTHGLFMSRYPGFDCVVRDERYGIYVREARGDDASRAESRSEAPTESRVVRPEDLAGAHVCLATPMHTSAMEMAYTVSLLGTQDLLRTWGIGFDTMFTLGASIDKNRNRIVAGFMAEPKYTHLLFVDADQGWEPSIVLRLLSHKKGVVGVASRKKTPQAEWAVDFLDEEEVQTDRGCFQVKGIGTGFLLIERSAIELMMDKYPHLRVTSREGVDEGTQDTYFALFQTHLNDEGIYKSEDLTFCERWRAIGGEVWVDPNCDLVHVGKKEYSGKLSSIVKATEVLL